MGTRTLLLMGGLVLAPGAAMAQRPAPDFSGAWVLRDSTALRTPPRDSVPPDTMVTDTTWGDSARRPRPGAMGGRRRFGPNPKEQRQIQLLLGMAQPVRAFTIAQTDSTVTVTNDDGFSYTVYLDGRKTVLSLTDSLSVETKAKWDQGALVIEYKPTGGGQLKETYHLADSRRYLRLEVAVEAKGMFRPFWQARMYRRGGAGGS